MITFTAEECHVDPRHLPAYDINIYVALAFIHDSILTFAASFLFAYLALAWITFAQLTISFCLPWIALGLPLSATQLK